MKTLILAIILTASSAYTQDLQQQLEQQLAQITEKIAQEKRDKIRLEAAPYFPKYFPEPTPKQRPIVADWRQGLTADQKERLKTIEWETYQEHKVTEAQREILSAQQKANSIAEKQLRVLESIEINNSYNRLYRDNDCDY